MFIYPRIELAFAVNGLELSCSLHAPRGHSCTSCPLILQAGPWTLKSPKTRKGDKNCFRPIIDDDHLFPHPTPSSPKKWRRYIICQNYDWKQSDVPVSRGSGAKICFPRWERSPLKCTPTLVFKIAIFAVKTPSCLAFPSRSYVKKCRSLSSVSLSVNSLFSTREMRELCVWKE